jgi:hypothetical protein
MAIKSHRVMRSGFTDALIAESIATLFPFRCRYFEVEGVCSKRVWFSGVHWAKTQRAI